MLVGRPQDLVKDLVKHPEDYVAIVTRCHAFDIECLAEALKTGAPYIGLIGSREVDADTVGIVRGGGRGGR